MRKCRVVCMALVFSLTLIAGIDLSLAVRFVPDAANEIVKDNDTGLIWMYYDVWNPVKLYANQAIAYCEGLTYAGFSDWRLPRIDELLTIINYSKRRPASYPELDNIPRASTSLVFGSSTIVNGHFYFWADVALDGIVVATEGNNVAPSTQYVRPRCVRLGPFWERPGLRLTSNTASTVLDPYSKNIWQKSDSDTVRDWLEAEEYCQALEIDGYSDWRLPTVYELAGILDYSEYNPDVSPMLSSVFTGHLGRYWSGTYLAGSAASMWAVDFETGIINRKPFTYNYYARCITDGEPAPPIPIPMQTLTVTKAGPDAGRVTSVPAGIDCGDTCSHEFPSGTHVILTVPMDGETTVTATFVE